ncbi:MAG TPA: hypothetical protein VK689_20000 [Armatimonadota bacterium]|nr:hypothetical protein [Armatimonadota bacterium]
MRRLILVPLLTLLAAVAASAQQFEELYSKHVQVFRPRGTFAPRLIKLTPAEGERWKLVDDQKLNYRLVVPASAEINATPAGSRVLQVVLNDAPARPRPLLRVDSFTPAEGDPTVIDADYVDEYVDQYPNTAFKGKFNVTDSGLVVLPKKVNIAMIGGVYPQGNTGVQRMQWSYLAADRQIFVTFDCAEREWDTYADTVGRILLSLDVMPKKGK